MILYKFEIKINIFLYHNVDRHVLYRFNGFLENDVVAKSFYATISLQSRTLPDQIMHITEFPQNIHEYHRMLATAQANAMKLKELQKEAAEEAKKEPKAKEGEE